MLSEWTLANKTLEWLVGWLLLAWVWNRHCREEDALDRNEVAVRLMGAIKSRRIKVDAVLFPQVG